MKPLLVAAVLGIAAVGATQSKGVLDFIGEIYPKDPARRQALSLCILADPGFNRLDRAARDACYRHASATPAAEPPQPVGRAPNEVDLGKGVGRANSPRNDIRIIEQSNGSTR